MIKITFVVLVLKVLKLEMIKRSEKNESTTNSSALGLGRLTLSTIIHTSARILECRPMEKTFFLKHRIVKYILNVIGITST